MTEKPPLVLPKHLEFMKSNYRVIEQIGEGTFSTVYAAQCKKTGMYLAIKCITKTSAPSRVLDELMIIKKLDGRSNYVRLLRVERCGGQILAVFPLIRGIDFKDFVVRCSPWDIRMYVYSLIRALVHAHANSVIHRDLKPSNFMYDMESGTGVLIDFGLAQYEKGLPPLRTRKEAPVLFFNSIVVPNKPPGFYQNDSRPPLKAPRAGTRGFRAPEVLFRSENQTCAIDMWSIGVILLSILTTQYPFFLSIEDIDNLVEIALIFGHAEMRKAAKLYGRVWKSNLSTIKEERMPFQMLIKRFNPSVEVNDEICSLLEGLLDLNCHTRITAAEALEHPFFRTDARY